MLSPVVVVTFLSERLRNHRVWVEDTVYYQKIPWDETRIVQNLFLDVVKLGKTNIP